MDQLATEDLAASPHLQVPAYLPQSYHRHWPVAIPFFTSIRNALCSSIKSDKQVLCSIVLVHGPQGMNIGD